jgi:hypothetical protein
MLCENRNINSNGVFMALFNTKLNLHVKFFYPWDKLDNVEVGGLSLHEELAENLWSGDFFRKIDRVLKRFYNVAGWDDESDSDDYIEVFFKDSTDSDSLHSDIDHINSELGFLWEEQVRQARENLQDYACENCEETDDYGECRGNCPAVHSHSKPSYWNIGGGSQNKVHSEPKLGHIEDCWDAKEQNGEGDFWQANNQPHPQEDKTIQDSCWNAREEEEGWDTKEPTITIKRPILTTVPYEEDEDLCEDCQCPHEDCQCEIYEPEYCPHCGAVTSADACPNRCESCQDCGGLLDDGICPQCDERCVKCNAWIVDGECNCPQPQDEPVRDPNRWSVW